MAERFLGKGFGRGIFGRSHNGNFVATFAVSLFTETPHQLSFELPPEFDVYLEYDPKPNGMIGVTGITIRFEEVLQ